MPNNYLEKYQIEILLKCYYLKNYQTVSSLEGLSVRKLKSIREQAFRLIRLAYSKSNLKGEIFNGDTVLKDMAERSEITTKELHHIFSTYIKEGIASENKQYWQRIRKKGEFPTPAELLEFIYDKFEIEIMGIIIS